MKSIYQRKKCNLYEPHRYLTYTYTYIKDTPKCRWRMISSIPRERRVIVRSWRTRWRCPACKWTPPMNNSRALKCTTTMHNLILRWCPRSPHRVWVRCRIPSTTKTWPNSKHSEWVTLNPSPTTSKSTSSSSWPPKSSLQMLTPNSTRRPWTWPSRSKILPPSLGIIVP